MTEAPQGKIMQYGCLYRVAQRSIITEAITIAAGATEKERKKTVT
jgi:hypothetical protein